MKRILSFAMAAILLLGALTGCSGQSGSQSSSKGASDTVPGASSAAKTMSGAITVISREDGSGTRGAFIELFGIEQKDANGSKVDYTMDSADITNSTSVMLTSVAQNSAAIGYVSLGSLNDTVRAVEIDGAQATVENIKNGTYKIARPFNIATTASVSAAAQDFIDFILSADGQKVVEDNGYIAASAAGAYAGSKPSGKIVIAGSSSVSPVMEKLKEAYLKINTNATIEMQTSDSTTGMNSAIEGVCDIGMASRALKDSEVEKGLTATVIAQDGIAVIVNLKNTLHAMTVEQVKNIYTGEITDWSKLG